MATTAELAAEAATATSSGLPATTRQSGRLERGAGEECVPPGQFGDHSVGLGHGQHSRLPRGLPFVWRQNLQTGPTARSQRTGIQDQECPVPGMHRRLRDIAGGAERHARKCALFAMQGGANGRLADLQHGQDHDRCQCRHLWHDHCGGDRFYSSQQVS